MSFFTVLGAGGFVGSHLVRHLGARGHVVRCPERDWQPSGNLGHVVYCIGLTADFRSNTSATIEAHTSLVARFLSCDCESFLYLSSTRLYEGLVIGSEDARLGIDPSNPDHLYNASKIAGEAICLSNKHKRWRVARVSNVIGPNRRAVDFIPSVLKDLDVSGRVALRTSPDSGKDYIAVADVTCLLERIALDGRHRLYNVASGQNTTNKEIASLIESQNWGRVDFLPNAIRRSFPVIDITRVQSEFGFIPTPFKDALAQARLS